jgi:hypothetical protein
MADASLIVLLDEVRTKTLQALEDVTREEARWAPPGLQNTILWHAGHCYILGEWLVIRRAGGEPLIHKDWFDMFSWESHPAQVPTERWPLPGEVIHQLSAQRLRLRRAISELTEEQLSQPLIDRPGRTVRSAIVHGFHDEACHCGEILLLKKLQRKGRRVDQATSGGS